MFKIGQSAANILSTEGVSMEKWQPIYFNKNYLISNHGRIYSKITSKLLKTAIDKYGYEIISLQTDSGRKTFKIHRLVIIHFGPVVILGKKSVNHIDGNKINNNINNLEWATNKEQQEHAIKLGLKKFKSGVDAPNVVYTEKIIEQICLLLVEGKKPKEIAEMIGCENNKKFHSLLYRIKSKRHWAHISNKYF